MFIGMRPSWRRVIKRRVRTGNLLHCLRAADSVTYVEYAPCWVRKVFYWGPQVG